MTLEEFNEQFDPIDGHYAVWTSGIIPREQHNIEGQQNLYGFSGAVVKYENRGGFADYPDWINTIDASKIKIALLECIPTLEELNG